MSNDIHVKAVAQSAMIVLDLGRVLGNSEPVQQVVASLPANIVTAIVLSFAEMHETDLRKFAEEG